MLKFLTKVFGSHNERELKRIWPIVQRCNEFEQEVKKLADADFPLKTEEFKKRIVDGQSLDDLLPEAFALCREAAVRSVGMRHFDMQLVGGIVLHEGRIAEMKTGEGKTLVATLAVYLNALANKGVHVVTVNDYLAHRDSEWMGQVYKMLGLSVGVIVHGLNDQERQEAYHADVTYGTNNEFGFDYLRDNMKHDLADYVQRAPFYAIVDEVDSILIDEARTPLIISGPAEESTEKYYQVDRVIPGLKQDRDYTIDEKAKTSILTDEGTQRVEERLGVGNLYKPENIEMLHHVNQALRAHVMFKLDVDYVVKDNQVMIVDEFTGRLMPGRRWSDGLHQAIEAKEKVKIENENQTLATITFQNYFRMYEKLAGMTGTAETEAVEFAKIYKLDVMVVPTNLDMIRDDHSDVIYKTEEEKFRAVIRDIVDCHERNQPTLVGTISIEKSEKIAKMLAAEGLKRETDFHVLNAKHHESEAQIVAQAGRKGGITIATNMAGRGTDIVLGGNPPLMAEKLIAEMFGLLEDGEEYTEKQRAEALAEAKRLHDDEREIVLEAGGLHIIGTERHESRRIDNQLRGRSGRQGDPGSSRFYLSLNDDLLRIFGSDRIGRMMETLGMEEDIPIEHAWINKAIENAQSKVEGHNFDIRKHLLEYDDVMNLQREVIYSRRKEVLSSESLKDDILEITEEVIQSIIPEYCEAKYPEEWDLEGYGEAVTAKFGAKPKFDTEEIPNLDHQAVSDVTMEKLREYYAVREDEFSLEMMRRVERFFSLNAIDSLWKDHLLSMDHLKSGIGLRGYGQRNPLQEYKREAYEMFQDLIFRIKEETAGLIFRIQVEKDANREKELMAHRRQKVSSYGRGRMPEASATALDAHQANQARRQDQEPPRPEPFRRKVPKVGRNDPCPCGSGKKYKKCCGT